MFTYFNTWIFKKGIFLAVTVQLNLSKARIWIQMYDSTCTTFFFAFLNPNVPKGKANSWCYQSHFTRFIWHCVLQTASFEIHLSLLCGSLFPSKFIPHSRTTIYSCLPATYNYHLPWGYADRAKKSKGPRTYLAKLTISLLSVRAIQAGATCWDFSKPTNKRATC